MPDRSSGLRRGAGHSAITAYRAWARVRGKVFSLAVAGAFDAFGPNSVLEPPLRLGALGGRGVAIGARVWVGAGSWLLVLRDPPAGQPAIVLGDGTNLAGGCVISAACSVRLGTDVLLARNVYVSDHIHRYRDGDRPVIAQGIEKVDAVDIGDGAWIGQNVVVCPGVRIGRGAVVAANSVVRDDVPDHCLAAGAPARVVRDFAARTDLEGVR